MTKNTIVERLLDQGHITVFWAAILLELIKLGITDIDSIQQGETATCRINELFTDGNIDAKEVLLLLSGNEVTD